MNKKFYLGAILLGAMTLSTGALTSCIDNDEPEGITNLRGAKAELLRAKAALELAKAETEKQNANLVAAKAAVEQANAKIAEAKAKQEEAKAKQEEAKVAYEQAKSEEAKAKALIAMADAQQAQAAAEANIAAIKAENEVYLQIQMNQLLEAQNKYDKLVAEIEAAKAVLTNAQAKKLASLQETVDSAWKKYTKQQEVVLAAMKKLFNATNKEIDKEETLLDELAKAQAKLEAVNAAYGELKALSENVAPTAWEARMDSLKAYGNKTNGTYKLEIAELELKKKEIKQSEAYKTAFVEDTTARRAYITAQQLYNYLADGNKNDCFEAGTDHEGVSDEANIWGYKSEGTHPTVKPYEGAKQYDLQGAKIVITNPEVYDKLAALFPTPAAAEAAGLFKDQQDNMGLKVDGTFVAYGGGELYSNLKNAFNTSGLPQTTITTTVAGWEAALAKVNVTDEEIAAGNCVADFEKAVADAQKAHNEAVAKWKKAHKTYSNQAVETSVSTDDFKAAIKKYNDNIDALEAAVTAYNTAFDAAFESIKAKHIEARKIEVAENEINTQLGAVGTVNGRTTLAQIDALIESSTLTADEKTAMKNAYRTAMNNKWNAQSLNDINTEIANAERYAATHAGSDASVTEADKVINKGDGTGIEEKLAADDEGWVNNAYTGSYATIEKAVEHFVVAAKDNSEQLTTDANTAIGKQAEYTGVAEADAKKYIKGGTKTAPQYAAIKVNDWVKDKFELDDNDNYVKKGHKVVVRTKVSDAAIQAMTAVEFYPEVAKDNWHNTSLEAFGILERHTELTRGLIDWENMTDETGSPLPSTFYSSTTLGKLIKAQNILADHQNLQGVNAEIASLKQKVAEAKAAMLAQIAEYTAAVNEAEAAIEPAKKEHQAKHKAAQALLKPVNDEIAKIKDIAGEYRDLAGKLQDILNAYYAINDFSYVDEDGETKSIAWSTNTTDKDFSQVAAWLKAEIAKYEKNDPEVQDSEGKIKDAEAAVADAQKTLDRWIADGEFDAVAKAQLALDNAQAKLETLKARYDFALSQLNDYVAALSK